MKFLVDHGVEADRIRLSQSAAFEPLTTRLESSWQDENNCVEVFLLTEMSGREPGTTPMGPTKLPAKDTAAAKKASSP